MKGLMSFIFDHQNWEKLYAKNCSLKTQAEWSAEGYANMPLGILYSGLGVLCMMTYIPFMIAMLKPEFIQHSCYKFMFLIGVIDLFVLPGNAIIAGIQCMFGLHFCANPTLFFWAGAIATAGWYGVSMSCVILAVDRFLEMCWPRAAKIIFGGKCIYFWLIFPIFYTLATFFQVPFLYSTKKFIFFPDPYFETEGLKGYPTFFELTFHCIHNVSVGFLLGGIYTALIIVLKIKTMIYKNVTITKIQKLLTLQAMCICIEMFIAALVYVYNEFFPLPNFIEIIAQISWIGVHGDTPIVYLLLNASLRKAVFKMMKNGRITFSTVGPSRSEAINRELKTAPISRSELEKVSSGAVCPEEIEYKH